MKKRIVLCFLICTLCIFYSSMPNPALGQGVSLAQRVHRKHNKTFQREDVREVLPQVLEILKAPDTQDRLNPLTISIVVNNPDFLPRFIPDIDPKFVALLKRDQELKNLLRDPQVQKLLQSPAAIDELAGLLGIGVEFRQKDLPAQQIYNQAIHSVVWIYTRKGTRVGSGSGALIDKDRRLVVTNQHVTGNAEQIQVFFPQRNQNRQLNRNQRFYVNNYAWLKRRGYATQGKVIKQNVRNDLAIIQLDRLFPGAREIKHDFSRNVEDNMRQGDKVHILGNPGKRLWNWTQGTFVQGGRNCLPSGGDCLELEADGEPGNSGGPVLNGQGTLIGILTAGNDETLALASPTRNIRALLETLRPRHTFRIRNPTGVTVPYQIKWTHNHNWKQQSVRARGGRVHRWNGNNVPQGYPKIRFDHIIGDQGVTYRAYPLKTSLQFGNNTDGVPTYVFRFNQRSKRLSLSSADVGAAPALSRGVPEENALFANYPNPFNPETWIPYQLAEPAEVNIAIYATDGTLVRMLRLGHQPAGVYQSKGRTAYWDGTNELGESVASGVYFYTLTVGEFTATRKLLIQK